jgi:hypothetical protein
MDLFDLKLQELNLPIIVDVEASGFGSGSYPIEVGFALSNRKTFCSLIQPCSDWVHWSDEAASVHGITREALQESGRTIEDIAQWLNDSFGNNVVYSDAWSHDMSWLGKLFDRADVTPTFRIDSILTLLNQDQIERWGAIKENVQTILHLERHRASRDALIIQCTYMLAKANIEEQPTAIKH